MRRPIGPDLIIPDIGPPQDGRYGDLYFSANHGLEESQQVFLSACGLPARWQEKPIFTIAETGLGSGLNLAATIKLWADTKPADGFLHIFSFEAHPMDGQVAANIRAHFPEIAQASTILANHWPLASFGIQRHLLADQKIAITYVIGPACEMMARLDFKADGWFLDGFAPDKNPDMWSADLFAQIGRLSAAGSIAATWCAAGHVRQKLADAGFDVRRVSGHGQKKHRTVATISGPTHIGKKRPQNILIIGGGVAASALAKSFLARNIGVTIIDDDPDDVTKASANPKGLVMPRLEKLETPIARFHRDSFLMTRAIGLKMGETIYQEWPVVEYARHERDRIRFEALLADPPLPDGWIKGDKDRLHHMCGAIVHPPAFCAALSKGANRIVGHVAHVKKIGVLTIVYDAQGAELARADCAILAGGAAMARLLADVMDEEIGPMARARAFENTQIRAGQISIMAPPAQDEKWACGGGGYGIGGDGQIIFGATFEPTISNIGTPAAAPPILASTTAGYDHNIGLLRAFAPEIGQYAQENGQYLSGRKSLRFAGNNHLPFFGQIAQSAGKSVGGIYAMGGFSARGLSASLLCAEALVCDILSEPSPMEIIVHTRLNIARLWGAHA